MESHQAVLLTREVFGNISSFSKALFYLLSLISLGIFCWGVFRRARLWRVGTPTSEKIEWRAALRNLWTLALMQRRVRGRGSASIAHRLLFGGFVILTIGTTLISIEHMLASLLGRAPNDPVFHKGLYFAIYEVIMDAAGIALLVGCALFARRRWRKAPHIERSHVDAIVLALLVVIGVTGYWLEGLRIIREQTPLAQLSFTGEICAQVFRSLGISPTSADSWHLATWWFHAILALTLIALFPFTRLLHAVAGTVRLAAGIDRLGALSPVSIEAVEETGELGVSRVEQFNRRQLLELDACVSCGRCEEACPAFEAGKPLSPRDVIQDVRRHLGAISVIPFWGPARLAEERISLVGGVIKHETLWSCTACTACVSVCPLGVNPLGFISDMRRSLVADGQLRGSPAQALQKMDRSGNPWGMPAQDRMAWAAGLQVPTLEQNPGAEVIYWIGCAAAYDKRVQKVARSVVTLLQAAKVNFAVLGKHESCTGEAARRMGDELLFQQLAGKNIETFKRFNISAGNRRVISHCPHCVNSFLQDYPQLGANLQVTHHTEFLAELAREGRIEITPKTSDEVLTYHDPCYLARAAGVTAAPRALLGLTGQRLKEMPRHGCQTACCGAGGGRMWFDDSRATRVGQSRVAEAIGTGARTLAVSCPFCLTMTSDGMAERENPMEVRDIAEILADSLGPSGSDSLVENKTSTKHDAL